MHYLDYPADPDCPKCHGTGTWMTSSKDCFGIGPCNCKRYENLKKVQDSCQHEYVCKKCGIEKPQKIIQDLKPCSYPEYADA